MGIAQEMITSLSTYKFHNSKFPNFSGKKPTQPEAPNTVSLLTLCIAEGVTDKGQPTEPLTTAQVNENLRRIEQGKSIIRRNFRRKPR